jgi:hypothetical protein
MYNTAERENADYVSANYIMMDEDGTKWEKPAFSLEEYTNFELNINDYTKSFFVMNSTPWNKIYNVKFLQENNINFDINPPSEDDYFTTLCYMKAKKGYYTNKVIYNYRNNLQSTSNVCSKDYFVKINDVYKSIYANFSKNKKRNAPLCKGGIFIRFQLNETAFLFALCRYGFSAGARRHVLTRLCRRLKPEAYGYRIVHSLHKYVVKVPHFFAQAALIQRTYLLQKHDGIFGKPKFLRVNVYVSGKLRLIELARYCRSDDRGTVFIADVVLYYEHGAHTALLRADDGAKVCIKNISSFNVHFYHTLFMWVICLSAYNGIFTRFGAFKS